MKVAFRVDASLHIGTGHVMRCLTLADALTACGAECLFICRAHEGNLIEFIRSKGYVAHSLPMCAVVGAGSPGTTLVGSATKLAHGQWLGATQAQDVEACAPILAALHPDWLIVDHYALDARWERASVSHYRKLMVIDDLADRLHTCDLLLDQTFGRDEADYRPLVSETCQLLCGAQFALLRPEFAEVRAYSLQRRARPQLRQLLISMGGVDKDNATSQVLEALRNCALPANCQITVVMGPTAPWLDKVRQQVQDMPWLTRVLVGVSNMAKLMADSDLAIGAAGATSWERCCLGLPTTMLVLAENQRKIAESLSVSGAANLTEMTALKNQQLFMPEHLESQALVLMSAAAAAITDGLGVSRVINNIICKN